MNIHNGIKFCFVTFHCLSVSRVGGSSRVCNTPTVSEFVIRSANELNCSSEIGRTGCVNHFQRYTENVCVPKDMDDTPGNYKTSCLDVNTNLLR